MCKKGAIANQALTLAFPIQILIIAIGVGTGIGLNALLSKSLGEKKRESKQSSWKWNIFKYMYIYSIFAIWFIWLRMFYFFIRSNVFPLYKKQRNKWKFKIY